MAKADVSKPVVLVVDDEPGIRRLSRRILESRGYLVVEADGADAAMAILESGTLLDVVLTDLQMPGVMGDELARRFREVRPDVPILYVTAFSDLLFDKHPVMWEGEAYLDKPFTSDGLLQAVSMLLYGGLDSQAPDRRTGWFPVFRDRLAKALRLG